MKLIQVIVSILKGSGADKKNQNLLPPMNADKRRSEKSDH